MTNFVLPLEKINKNDVLTAGGKGASLGELNKIVSVPDGFVLPTSTFNTFIQFNDFEKIINKEMESIFSKNKKDLEIDIKKINRSSSVLSKLILGGKIPKEIKDEIFLCFDKYKMEYVAVRSSASMEDGQNDSWAGELESYLNTDRKSLIRNIKKCWASLFSPRAISYLIEKKISFKNNLVAVVVQKMIQSEVSGIVFTVHPVNKKKNQMLIESCFGLGELIVGGIVTPDSYIFDKKEKLILEINVNHQKKQLIKKGKKNILVQISNKKRYKQKLSGPQIIELAKLSKKIEKHYKKPQDIEWAFKNNKFYIVQSRPITTL
ncbi:MAG: hypothetical protein KAI71_03955 [Candidatus Pacebacteria bacterium]|nr:hypothetical protein [Candidatus Paceibacterota bacterium]